MGRLFVISAPSGSGKTTLCRQVLARRPDVHYSISYTTRPPRERERDGVDYNFISPEQFQGMAAQNGFLEWAQVFGRFYGTGKAWVVDQLTRGFNVLVDIDVLGARQIKSCWPEAVMIFLVPPTYDELGRRLAGRLTENQEAVAERLKRAVSEIAQRSLYDYLVINDDLKLAETQLLDILDGRPGASMQAQEAFWPKFFANHPELYRQTEICELPAENKGGC